MLRTAELTTEVCACFQSSIGNLQSAILWLVALVAVMRKLLHAIFGMFKHQTAFDGSKVYRLDAQISTEEAA
ncbi:MAG: hypothetical protein ACLQOO_28950 [Terriglobia bacterium]